MLDRKGTISRTSKSTLVQIEGCMAKTRARGQPKTNRGMVNKTENQQKYYFHHSPFIFKAPI